MARRSGSSSSRMTNGHIPEPTTTQETPIVTHIAQDDDDDDKPHFDFENDTTSSHPEISPVAYDPSLFPKGSRSLSSIGLQSFWLGFTLAFCLLLSLNLALQGNKIWRLPAFFACLSLFHFLEYYTTARYNMPAARASSFLLFNNGTAYNVAHGMAAFEVTVSYFFPSYQAFMVFSPWTIVLGLVLVGVGQSVRSVAMAQAGTNFNHTPVKTRKADHELVTTGLYARLRHPSYFGFFWWALGTQILVGNKFCLLGYAAVLWRFFYTRIIAEERTLVGFFGKDYEEFRKRTPTGIPFVP